MLTRQSLLLSGIGSPKDVVSALVEDATENEKLQTICRQAYGMLKELSSSPEANRVFMALVASCLNDRLIAGSPLHKVNDEGKLESVSIYSTEYRDIVVALLAAP